MSFDYNTCLLFFEIQKHAVKLFTFRYKNSFVIVCCFHWTPLGFKMTHVSLWTWGYPSRELGVRKGPQKRREPLWGGCFQKDLAATAVSLKRVGCLHMFLKLKWELTFDSDYLYTLCQGAWHDFLIAPAMVGIIVLLYLPSEMIHNIIFWRVWLRMSWSYSVTLLCK